MRACLQRQGITTLRLFRNRRNRYFHTTTNNRFSVRDCLSTMPASEPVIVSTFPVIPSATPIKDVESLTRVDVLDEILLLPQVRIRDEESVKRKLAVMQSDGAEKLLVISDFDYTLSRFVDEDGTQCWTTHGVFDNSARLMDPKLGEKFQTLKNKFHPIEFDPNMTMEEKVPYMEEWWEKSHGHIIEAGFTKSVIQQFVRDSKVVLRDGTADWMLLLENSNIPLVIFSAGIGNIIEFFFEEIFGRDLKNNHLISNMMIFNGEEKVEKFSEPLIHTFCKNSSVIKKEASFFHQMNSRANVILMGDSMGDIHMDVGVEKAGPTLKIGYLNANVDGLLDHYMDVYDIVLISDQSITVPDMIVKSIIQSQS